MPSHHLIRQYADLVGVEKEWRWSGVHDQRTALDWLENFDTHRGEIERVLSQGPWRRDRAVDAALALVPAPHRGAVERMPIPRIALRAIRAAPANKWMELGSQSSESGKTGANSAR
jgi:hypothetical protein